MVALPAVPQFALQTPIVEMEFATALVAHTVAGTPWVASCTNWLATVPPEVQLATINGMELVFPAPPELVPILKAK